MITARRSVFNGPAVVTPARRRRHVVSLSAVTWDFGLVGRTRMLTEAWLRQNHPTLFVQIPSMRTALEKIIAPLRAPSNAPVVRPWPIYPSRWWNPNNESRLRRAIKRRGASLRRQMAKKLDFQEATAVVVSPIWTPWLEQLPFKHVVYDCIDDVAVHVSRPRLTSLMKKWEDELIQRASGAVVTSEMLGDDLRQRRADLPISTIRNGVDVDRFERLAAAAARPTDLPNGERPIVGFVGALYDWIDWKLIAEACLAMPDCDFVLVGPSDKRFDDCDARLAKNAYFYGARLYSEVPAYMRAFDVCWTPFDQSRVSRAANPVKIYEYLAMGKPVVTTPVADTDKFDDLVRVGVDRAEIIEHLRAALTEEPRVEERKAFARANSWDVRAAEYVSFIQGL